ncbi:SDR family oxidoreductase [Pelagibacterium lacus]|uniref:SDR family NAD(P)-dependent oxidoreductase n=1 Tax=Pelagibacterium lacus TaxID=2282655 RepID=A0A369W616_9HYPH|nr:SDR family oxidoreductase [Pelagibacterium lacus]RDE08702.1 SDR family NAD(P)-dependent oxidoreductase [Pelagibacterium lacus]
MPLQPIAVIVGATSKWQHADGSDTLPLEVRWGVGGAIAQRFAKSGFQIVVTTRRAQNAAELCAAVTDMGGSCRVVEMDLGSEDSVAAAFNSIREQEGEPDALIYNAGHVAARHLPAGQELLEYVSISDFDVAQTVSCRGPFLVVNQVLPGMRKRGSGAIFFTNNASCLRGRKRRFGESLYYPRTQLRALAQVLTDEYTEHGIHVANVIVDGQIDSPGTRALSSGEDKGANLVSPAAVADGFHYLYHQDPSCWTHEIQFTPKGSSVSNEQF